MTHDILEHKLDDFDRGERTQALKSLVEKAVSAFKSESENVNMHLHSFFSYNSRGFSPSHLAWESRKAGLYAAALCDFDVLDGQDEFLDAALVLGLRAAVHLETRAYLKEFAHVEINSPGEPGVTYIMGAGFARPLDQGSPEAKILGQYRQQAAQRNRDLVARINPHVPAITIDYENDVVPLSPGKCPTERHIIRAYVLKAAHTFPQSEALLRFWSGLLKLEMADTVTLLGNQPALEERVRAKFAKKGGFGYVQPDSTTFPPADDFIRWVLSCKAIPMVTWLDGTSAGESDPKAMLECLLAKGAVSVNIVPDRNWNIKDAAQRAVKIVKLKEFVAAADAMRLPINIGTEMNRDGLPFVDDLAGAELKPYRDTFIHGAQVMIGHSILLRFADFSYTGAAADGEFGTNRAARNRFFASVGALPPLTKDAAVNIERLGPAKALDSIRVSIRQGRWIC